jgi:aspartokinase-like uncharacterized kinase
MLRVLVTGGRDYRDGQAVSRALSDLREKHGDILIIQGGASGADQLARDYAHDHRVEYLNYPADWRGHGKSAGPIRNQRMIDDGKPDLVLAFPGGRGTADMVRRAEEAGVLVTHCPTQATA